MFANGARAKSGSPYQLDGCRCSLARGPKANALLEEVK